MALSHQLSYPSDISFIWGRGLMFQRRLKRRPTKASNMFLPRIAIIPSKCNDYLYPQGIGINDDAPMELGVCWGFPLRQTNQTKSGPVASLGKKSPIQSVKIRCIWSIPICRMGSTYLPPIPSCRRVFQVFMKTCGQWVGLWISIRWQEKLFSLPKFGFFQALFSCLVHQPLCHRKA